MVSSSEDEIVQKTFFVGLALRLYEFFSDSAGKE